MTAPASAGVFIGGRMFIEYPKAMHMKGDAEADYVVVESAEDEEKAREFGYAMIGEKVDSEPLEKQSAEPEEAPKRRGRPKREAE